MFQDTYSAILYDLFDLLIGTDTSLALLCVLYVVVGLYKKK
ncbi:hypothetical protein E2C01_022104 [Portunus trituberculatus]|uniref:Uncharacterized protein n=1 Tax=Portunus trituberculatus TaxID=210409 RepID=A0A5B7E4D2_PORTR|nr:hypothetical protein [Portunus trituberculatus]